MARTAVVNPRKRRRRRRNANGQFSSGGGGRTANPRRKKRRRRNYGAAAANPRRRRSKGRRRNPASVYSTGGYYRRPNPTLFDMDDLTDTVPAATAGVWAGRWAVKQAGAFEPAKDGTLEPGIKHAVAIWVAAAIGGQLVGQMLGSEAKGNVARIACLGYGGDLFMRGRFMRDSAFVQNNLSLQGFQEQSALGAPPTMVDAFGNSFVSTPQGWQLQGGMGADEGDFVEIDGEVYQLEGAAEDAAALNGFSQESRLGMVPATPGGGSSFGYC